MNIRKAVRLAHMASVCLRDVTNRKETESPVIIKSGGWEVSVDSHTSIQEEEITVEILKSPLGENPEFTVHGYSHEFNSDEVANQIEFLEINNPDGWELMLKDSHKESIKSSLEELAEALF